MKQQLEAVARMTGVVPEELKNASTLPPIAKQAWEFFLKLNSRRSSNGYGPLPISYTEIKAFCDLEGVQLEQWELYLILEMDNVAMNSFAKSQEKRRKQEEAKAKAKSTKQRR